MEKRTSKQNTPNGQGEGLGGNVNTQKAAREKEANPGLAKDTDEEVPEENEDSDASLDENDQEENLSDGETDDNDKNYRSVASR